MEVISLNPMEVNLFEYHKLFIKDILISYKGPFDQFIVAKFSNRVRELTANNPISSKKIHNVFMELAQNVAYYSKERRMPEDIGIGTVVLGESDQFYIFGTGNIVCNEEMMILKQKCEIINSLDHENLREYKRQQRNLIPGTKGNAHIGLIMSALVARTPLNAIFTPIDSKSSYFSIMVKVDKSLDKEID